MGIPAAVQVTWVSCLRPGWPDAAEEGCGFSQKVALDLLPAWYSEDISFSLLYFGPKQRGGKKLYLVCAKNGLNPVRSFLQKKRSSLDSHVGTGVWDGRKRWLE